MKKFIFFLVIAFLTSCVGKKKFISMQTERDNIRLSHSRLEEAMRECERDKAEYRADISRLNDKASAKDTQLEAERRQINSMQKQIDNLQSTNQGLLDRLSDLSVISKAGAENIQKSLEAINSQHNYIKDLVGTIQRKDSTNLTLVTNLKRSLSDVDDKDVNVEVKKGVVYISLSDKMLFSSGSYIVNPSAETVLGKIATVINDHKDLDVLVESHTDNVPIKKDCIKDNWDLSSLRSTSVVRFLQTKFAVSPERMTAGGRGEFVPKASNETADGKSINRRTEIIILPKLDQFFKLLEPNNGGNNTAEEEKGY